MAEAEEVPLTTHDQVPDKERPFRIPFWLGATAFLLIALFFLWEEHRAHMLGALPYVLILACPLLHVFMHHGHSDKDQGAPHQH